MTATAAPFVRGRQSDAGLKLSCDRKVSPHGTWQESRSRWVPDVPNSFGLPSGDSCPGRTPFCESCYAAGSEQSAGVRALVEHNLRLLRAAGTVPAMADLILEALGRFRAEHARRRLSADDLAFRVHWDGDFFSVGYAEAWARAMAAHPDVRFWAYTRSFAPPVDVVPTLAEVPNLVLYLSADAHNVDAARAQVARFPTVRLALYSGIPTRERSDRAETRRRSAVRDLRRYRFCRLR